MAIQLSEVDAALESLQRDLDWRGPSGRPQGIITLPRDLAEALLRYAKQKRDDDTAKVNPDYKVDSFRGL